MHGFSCSRLAAAAGKFINSFCRSCRRAFRSVSCCCLGVTVGPENLDLRTRGAEVVEEVEDEVTELEVEVEVVDEVEENLDLRLRFAGGG